MDFGCVKIRWVREELGDDEATLRACAETDGMSCDSFKGTDCSVDVG